MPHMQAKRTAQRRLSHQHYKRHGSSRAANQSHAPTRCEWPSHDCPWRFNPSTNQNCWLAWQPNRRCHIRSPHLQRPRTQHFAATRYRNGQHDSNACRNERSPATIPSSRHTVHNLSATSHARLRSHTKSKRVGTPASIGYARHSTPRLGH